MPDITELLEQAAPGTVGPAPIDDIVRRARRRRATARGAAVGTPLALVAVAATGLMIVGGGPAGVTVDDPPMAGEPEPEPPATPGELEPPPADEPDDGPTPQVEPEPPGRATDVGWVEPSGLRADVLVVSADGGPPALVRLGADGAVDETAIDDGVPNRSGMFVDGDGGVVWQPDWESAGEAPVLHVGADGEVSTLVVGNEDAAITLVGWDEGRDLPLVTSRTGDGIEDVTADLLVVPLDGGEPELVREGVGAWESGLAHAAMLDTALYAQYVEAMQYLILDPATGEPQVVYEGGELTGEYLTGVAIHEGRAQGVALVGTRPGIDDEPQARLLLVDLGSGEIVEEVEVPLGEGFEGDTAPAGIDARDVSIVGDHVLVNRYREGVWVAPLVHDLDAGTWSELEHVEAGPVVGRAVLAPTFDRDETAGEQAACLTEDAHLRNAEPLIDRVSLYLPCKDQTRPGFVYRVPSGIEPTGDVDVDLTAALEVLVEPLLDDDDLTARGYYLPADRGQPRLHSASVADGHAVVDLGFPDGVGNLTGSFIGSVWHAALRGTVFQFPEVETFELRLDGSCEDYATTFQADPECLAYDRTSAPWAGGLGA